MAQPDTEATKANVKHPALFIMEPTKSTRRACATPVPFQ
jgi:hypothetical protein